MLFPNLTRHSPAVRSTTSHLVINLKWGAKRTSTTSLIRYLFPVFFSRRRILLQAKQKHQRKEQTQRWLRIKLHIQKRLGVTRVGGVVQCFCEVPLCEITNIETFVTSRVRNISNPRGILENKALRGSCVANRFWFKLLILIKDSRKYEHVLKVTL